MISRVFALKLFEAFSIQRWNDKIRPIQLPEMDKQAFKCFLTYFFAKEEEHAKGIELDWRYLVYASFFNLLKNIALSDIKAPVTKKIKKEYPNEWLDLNNWVADQYLPIADDDDLIKEFRDFITSDDGSDINIGLKIIEAAHKYSTEREIDIIEPVNTSSPLFRETKKEFRTGLAKYSDLRGVQLYSEKTNWFEAMCLIDQLRYQVRWSQTQRIPQTSVLGHSMLVACFMLLFSRELNACKTRTVNNFFAGLFHDLPESVVRDIISPVKRATVDLPDIVRKIEGQVCAEELYPKMPGHTHKEISYLLGTDSNGIDEFTNRYVDEEGVTRVIGDSDGLEKYNEDRFKMIDGALLKVADEMAAFLEAERSISYGVSSTHLQNGMANIRFKYLRDKPVVNNVNIQRFFLEFD